MFLDTEGTENTEKNTEKCNRILFFAMDNLLASCWMFLDTECTDYTEKYTEKSTEKFMEEKLCEKERLNYNFRKYN